MSGNIQGTFTSEKISKIRWKRDDFKPAESFVTGSWDNLINSIKYWIFEVVDDEANPISVSSVPFDGDVTEIQFISKDSFAVSSSNGGVKLIQITENPYAELKEINSWDNLHQFQTLEPASCTKLATFNQDIATVGEDGKINLLTAQQKRPVRVIENADSCALVCIDFLRHNEILTSNNRGHMKLWDLRNDQDTPATTFMLPDQLKTEVKDIAHHPTQKHIVAAGGGDGTLAVWDLRKSTFPSSQFTAHNQAISEVYFHPDRPDNFFSCSISGELWHWHNIQASKLKFDSNDSHWLATRSTDTKLNISALCAPIHKPINSFNIDRSTLIFGCDNEAVYVIKDVPI